MIGKTKKRLMQSIKYCTSLYLILLFKILNILHRGKARKKNENPFRECFPCVDS